jgi:hypothetical protein
MPTMARAMPRTAPTTERDDGGERGRHNRSATSSIVSTPSPAETCTSRRLKNFAPNDWQLHGTIRVAKSYLAQFNKPMSFDGSFTYRAVPGPTIDHSEPQVGTTNGSVPDGRDACQQLSMPSLSHQKSIPLGEFVPSFATPIQLPR